jgi:hypothetical protein
VLVAVMTVASLALAAFAGAPSAHAVDTSAIEGTWAYQGGRVSVEPSGPGTYRGRVTASTRFLTCDHPVGEIMWDIAQNGDGTFAGTHQWFQDPNCTPAPGGRATWAVREDGERLVLDFCTAPPGSGEPTEDNPQRICSTLERAKPAVPRPEEICLTGACIDSAEDIQTIGCLRRGEFQHRFRVTLRRAQRRDFRVRSMSFSLDGVRIGTDRRPPFYALINGSRLRPGLHVLGATVKLTPTRRGKRLGARSRKLTLRYSFSACT